MATELGGNLLLYWALGAIGIAVAIPLSLAFILTGSAVLGWIWLGERVSIRAVAAIAVLIGAVSLLTVGAQTAQKVIGSSVSSRAAILGVLAACGAGVIFSVLATSVRVAATRGNSLALIMVIITASGVLTLGPLSVKEYGVARLLETPSDHVLLMLAAGLFNLVGFAAAIKGLQVTTVVHATAIGSSQNAMAAVVGLRLGEPITAALVLGIGLTIGGMILIDRPRDE